MTDHGKDRRSDRNRRKVAEVFGEVLPNTTSDERSDNAGSDERSDNAGNIRETERWYRENRPPHHDS